MLCAGMSWVRSMIWACGLMPRITPFMLPTKTSAAPKSVSRVMMGGGAMASGSSGVRAILCTVTLNEVKGLSQTGAEILRCAQNDIECRKTLAESLGILEADVAHFVLHDFGRRLDLDGLSHPLADEGASDR